jgi:hypothetical protein
MRKLLSILLLLATVLPVAAPAFALGQDADAGLPACCRRHGKHHCMMGAAERGALVASTSKAPAWQTPLERCPYCPAAVAAMHPNVLAAPAAEALYAGVVSHPAGAAHVESKLRISRDRSRQKRGPPVLLA